MHAGIHNFELHAFRAAFQMVPNHNLVLLHAKFNFLYSKRRYLALNIKNIHNYLKLLLLLNINSQIKCTKVSNYVINKTTISNLSNQTRSTLPSLSIF